MAAPASLFDAINMWVGFVGSCVADGGAACRPFLGFVALAASACAALILLVLAWRSLGNENAREPSLNAERITREPVMALPPRVLTLPEPLPIAAFSAAPTTKARWHATA
jgi:hypothetical protein